MSTVSDILEACKKEIDEFRAIDLQYWEASKALGVKFDTTKWESLSERELFDLANKLPTGWVGSRFVVQKAYELARARELAEKGETR